MSLDLLISKYLDGDLSVEDDMLLRQIVKEDADAKVQFDSAILLNAAFKEDAESIKAPAEIVSQTEDLVLMKILNSVSVDNRAAAFAKPKRRFSWAPALSFIFAVFVIGGIFTISEISDINTNFEFAGAKGVAEKSNIDKLELAETAQPESMTKATIITRKNVTSNRVASIANVVNAISVGNNEIVAVEAVPSVIASSDVIADVPQTAAQSSNIQGSPAMSKDRYIVNAVDFDFNSRTITLSDFGSRRMNQSVVGIPFMDQISFGTSVNLTSYYGRDMVNKKGKYRNSNPISSYSQSIGYNVSDKFKLGIEVGATNYEFDYLTYVKVPNVEGGALNSKVEIGNYNGNELYVPVNINQNAQLYWFSTYMDYDVVSNNWISLQSRVGAGMSVEGSVVYSRLMAELHVYKGIYLNFGAEAKGFDAKVSSGRNAFLGTGSMIYGLQIKLND